MPDLTPHRRADLDLALELQMPKLFRTRIAINDFAAVREAIGLPTVELSVGNVMILMLLKSEREALTKANIAWSDVK